jgi:hypothetical protein
VLVRRKQKAPPMRRGFPFMRAIASAVLTLLTALARAILLLLLLLAGPLAALLLLAGLLLLPALLALLLLTRPLAGILIRILIHVWVSSRLVRSFDFDRSRPQRRNNAQVAQSFPVEISCDIDANALAPAATAIRRRTRVSLARCRRCGTAASAAASSAVP